MREIFKNREKKDFFRWMISSGCILIMLFSILTIVRASAYSVLVEDDYWHGYDVGVFGGGWSYFIASLKYSGYMYMNWQGTYFSMFMQALLSPVNHYGMLQLRIVMLFNSINFFASLIGCVWVVSGRIFQGQRLVRLVLCTCTVFAMTAYSSFEEIFYWFSGAASYSIPMSCLLYSWIALCRSDVAVRKGRKYFLIIMVMLLGLCAMGGSLTIAATGCGAVLLLCVYSFLVHKSVNRVYLSVFTVYLVGALLNAAAPGNFIRQKTSEGGGMHLTGALFHTYQVYESNLHWVFNRTNFGIVLLIVLICGMFLQGKMRVDRNRYTIVSVLALLIPGIAIFPVVLGYNLSWMPNRCVFILLLVMVLIFYNLALLAGWWIVETVLTKNRRTVAVMTFLLIFALGTVNGYHFSDYASTRVFKKLCKGTIQNYHREYIDMLHLIKLGKGTDFVLEPSDIPEPIEDFYCFDLSTETDERMNKAIAYIYQLNSIAKGTE